jgi:two-component system cell cycle response regulator DivK
LNTLLLIEDDLNAARMVRKVLAPHDYEIFHATTGLEGLKLAREVKPNIVLVDMNLPDLEGKVIVVQLRGQILAASVPVIAFTADDDARTRRLVRLVGCDDLIGKPINTRAFPTQITELIQRKAGSTNHGKQ